MKVAFYLFSGNKWTGGLHYLINLLSSLREIPNNEVEPILFTGFNDDVEVIENLKHYLSLPPVQSDLWTSGSSAYKKRIFDSFVLQKDTLAEHAFRDAGVDVVFQHNAWFGFRFGLPTLVWLADFQHRHLPEMFGHARYWKRELFYRSLIMSATRIMVSSEDARCDCEKFYPYSKKKIAVVPFAVKVDRSIFQQNSATIREKYQLPEKFFFLPNQFWKHKNHLGVIEALKLTKSKGEDVVIAVSGNPDDMRNPEHFGRIMAAVKGYNLSKQFRVLGLIPHIDIMSLMRASVAVINPSFFEGWSTTVEEAKAIGVPLLLSDIPVHREQSPEMCLYFNPADAKDIATALIMAWNEWKPGPHDDLEKSAQLKLPQWRHTFATSFASAIKET